MVCEVPLTFSVEECWRLVLAAERAGRILAMAEQLSYSPFTLAWRRLVEDGSLGKVLYAEAEYIHGIPANRYWMDGETGRSLTWEEAQTHPRAQKTRFWTMTHPIWYVPHSLGPLLRILDSPVTMVTCVGTRPRSYSREQLPVPDLEAALMRTAGDTVLRLTAGFVAPNPWPHHWFHVRGTLGEVDPGARALGSLHLTA